ncbi:ABC transporter permease [Dermabacter sp. p3-SID358]|uniref:ABC transporter permease n=1 Tax=Dermabacter sp. p3-SID358 TaxID=2916114 RepID=UPI0021A55B96|nr:ABC transporter permease [Dermabacter sp. p3-SID358]MCT1866692.1 ABC transporter permease [Dermabacter sp. p3-SID358]
MSENDAHTNPNLAQRIGRSEVSVVIGAFVISAVIGSILILVANEDVRDSLGYVFARPSDFFSAAWAAISGAYEAMFRGAIFDYKARTSTLMWRPLFETLTVATPLVIAAYGMAVGFRAGMFNIGGTGQLLMGAAMAGYVGFTWTFLPPVIHLVVALVVGALAGAVWGGIAGFLKARFEANEVISTIMLNWIAVSLLGFLLTTEAFTAANTSQPVSPNVAANAQLPTLLTGYRLHAGIFIMLLAGVFMWWLLTRSSLGFKFRTVGENPRAAQVAGIKVGTTSLLVMVVAGALVGLAGSVHLLGTEHRLTSGIAGSIGFDAITVALLGRSGPIGILLAGLLFAALGVGGRFMESSQGVPIDLVSIVQALVVLFIAAPPLVRTLTGLSILGREKKTDATSDGERKEKSKDSDATSANVGTPKTPAAAGSHRADAPADGATDASKEA